VRATNGKGTRRKEKLSTVVKSKDVVAFQLAYARLLASATDNLKKAERRRKKRKGGAIPGDAPAPASASKHL